MEQRLTINAHGACKNRFEDLKHNLRKKYKKFFTAEDVLNILLDNFDKQKCELNAERLKYLSERMRIIRGEVNELLIGFESSIASMES